MDLADDMQSVADFRDHAEALLKRLKETRRPFVLTVDGEPTAVVQDAEAYRRLRDLAALASEEEGIRQGLEDIALGRTRDAEEVFDEFRARHGLPR